ncbi:hypothetical protein HYT92_01255 [Candidatus Pacearchaeota archaeon]|nr:hypothetical protein [Candidatus Pacearchaeota archaeon]
MIVLKNSNTLCGFSPEFLTLISIKKKPALVVLLITNKTYLEHIRLLRKIKEQRPETKIIVFLLGAYLNDFGEAGIKADYFLKEEERLSELMPERMLGLLGESETDKKELKEDIERFLAPHYFNSIITM